MGTQSTWGVQLRRSVETQLFPSWHKITTDKMEANLSATFDAGNSFNSKSKDTLEGLLGANNERKAEIAALRGDHDQLKSDHDAQENNTTRENDLRKNEVKSLEERTLPSRALTATLVVVLILTLVSSPAPPEEPTCSNSTSPPTTTRRPFCPSARMEKRLLPSSTRTIRTTTRTAWLARTSSWMSRGEMRSSSMPTLELGWLTSP